ncbi:hypothetical protein ACLOJK_016494 [Asimina triloba]
MDGVGRRCCSAMDRADGWSVGAGWIGWSCCGFCGPLMLAMVGFDGGRRWVRSRLLRDGAGDRRCLDLGGDVGAGGRDGRMSALDRCSGGDA